MKRLVRSRRDRKIAGVCGGLGELFNLDPTLVRLAFVFLWIVTGFVPLTIAYIVGWLIVPESETDSSASPTA
jgi:phage shock protein C